MSNLLTHIERLKPGFSTHVQGFNVRLEKNGTYSVFRKGFAPEHEFQEIHKLVAFLETYPSPPPNDTCDLLNYLLRMETNRVQLLLGCEVLPNFDGTFSVLSDEKIFCFQDADNAAAFLYSRGGYPQVPKEMAHPYGYVDTEGLAELCKTIHKYNVEAGWWTNIETGERLERNIPEMLMLVVSEVSEAMEGHRKNLMDDKLPHRKMIEVELADAIIRICDMAEGLGLDLAGAVREKVLFNTSRPDHKIENRLKENGKKF